MEGGCRRNGVEGLMRQRPVLERRHVQADAVEARTASPRDGGESSAQLDRDDVALGRREWDCQLPGPTADLQDAAAHRQAREAEEIRDERCGIPGANPVVEVGVLAEGGAEPGAVGIGHEVPADSPSGMAGQRASPADDGW